MGNFSDWAHPGSKGMGSGFACHASALEKWRGCHYFLTFMADPFDYRTMLEPPERPFDKEFMATLAKGLRVLELFGRERPSMTLSQAADLTQESRATARRILHTLRTLGYVEQKGRDFFLTPRVLDLGFGWIASQTWIDRAQPVMRALTERFSESCYAAILEGDEVVFVAHAASQRVMQNAIGVGARLTAFHTAVGRVMLGAIEEKQLMAMLRTAKLAPLTPLSITDRQALFDRIRDDAAQGFSIVDEEYEKGLRSLAVPVVARSGRTFAALTITTPSTRMTRTEMRERFLGALKEAAEEVGSAVVT